MSIRLNFIRQQTAIPAFDPKSLVLRRIGVGRGWAVHTLVFEYEDGTRAGVNLANNHSSLPLDDGSLAGRLSEWRTLSRGDSVVRISGHHGSKYICHSIAFHLASGNEIAFAAAQTNWKRGAFSCDFPEAGVPADFSTNCHGRITNFSLVATSVHLQITPESLHNLRLRSNDPDYPLERHCYAAFGTLWEMFQQREVPEALVWKILGHLCFEDIYAAV